MGPSCRGAQAPILGTQSRTRPKRWTKTAEKDGGNAWRGVFSPAFSLSLETPDCEERIHEDQGCARRRSRWRSPVTRSQLTSLQQPAVRLRVDLAEITADDNLLRKLVQRDIPRCFRQVLCLSLVQSTAHDFSAEDLQECQRCSAMSCYAKFKDICFNTMAHQSVLIFATELCYGYIMCIM